MGTIYAMGLGMLVELRIIKLGSFCNRDFKCINLLILKYINLYNIYTIKK